MKTNSDTLEMPRDVEPTLSSGEGVKVQKAVTINRSVSEVFSFWRQLENLPRFLTHLVSVTPTSEVTSHWIAQTKRGKTMEWDVQITDEKPDELIAWQSLPDSDIKSAGSIRFKPAPPGRGTVLKISLEYAPGHGGVARAFAKIFGRTAEEEIARDLFHLKSLLETGEIPTIQGQPKGNREMRERCL